MITTDKDRDLVKPSLREEERIKRNLQKIQPSKRSMGNHQSYGTLLIIPMLTKSHFVKAII